MIVVGVDPGGRDTGLAVISVATHQPTYDLLASLTLRRDGGEILDVDPAYLLDVAAAVAAAVRDHDADLVAVEALRRPNAHHRGKVNVIDPSGVMATAAVWGATIGRSYHGADAGLVPLTQVPPGRNGSAPLAAYPEQLRPTRGIGAGKDKLRHERSAYDVAVRGVAAYRLERLRRS